MSFHDPKLAPPVHEPAGKWRILVYTTTGGPFRGRRCFASRDRADYEMQIMILAMNQEGPDCVLRTLDGKIRWGDFLHYRIEQIF